VSGRVKGRGEEGVYKTVRTRAVLSLVPNIPLIYPFLNPSKCLSFLTAIRDSARPSVSENQKCVRINESAYNVLSRRIISPLSRPSFPIRGLNHKEYKSTCAQNSSFPYQIQIRSPILPLDVRLLKVLVVPLILEESRA
jgi:hypothetical protein